jgi:hypothetical protein
MAVLPAEIDHLASRQGGVVARKQLLESGLSEWQLRRALETGLLESIMAGVMRLPGSPRSEMQRLWAAHLRVGAESVLALGSAARLWGLKSIEECRPTLVVPHHRTPKTESGMIVHRTRRLEEVDVGAIDGLPVTRPARTLVDLSSETGKARLTAALEEAHYDRIVGYTEVGRALVRLGEAGRHGAVLLAELLDERTGGRDLEQSALERLLSDLFDAAGITDVIRQHPLPSDAFDDDGRGHAARGAHGDQAALQVAPLQLVEHGADQDGAGGADRVAEGHRAAVDVDLVAVESRSRMNFSATTAKASLISHRSMSSSVRPARQHLAGRRHRRVEHQRRVCRPCWPWPPRGRAASGRGPWRSLGEASSSAAAPSTTPDELPAWWTCSM